jgi:hypothetical protein
MFFPFMGFLVYSLRIRVAPLCTLLFLISKKNFYKKKRKAALGTQEVYTGTTKANPKKPTTPRPQNTNGNGLI